VPTTDLSEISGEVVGLITDKVFHGALGVLTLVASHFPTLDFAADGRGASSNKSTTSADRLRELEQSFVPVAMAIEEVTTAEWVKEARHAEREETLGRDGGQSTEAESSAAPTL
jgi:hypothetical protein